jgi:outer membrane protein
MKRHMVIAAFAMLVLNSSASAQVANTQARVLTVSDAEHLAITNNPTVTIAKLRAMSSTESIRETKSALFPNANADLTAVDSDAGSRIAAGALNNPVIYPRAAYGATISQLLTDFGGTTNTIEAARLNAKAERQSSLATARDVALAADRAFYGALVARDVLKVAEQTVNQRQTVVDQVSALEQNKLKSSLDLSFAEVNLQQGKLLLVDAQNRYEAALAVLSEVMGFKSAQHFDLVDSSEDIKAPQESDDSLIKMAMTLRPELDALRFTVRADQRLASAAHDQALPSIRALGAVGQAPVRDDHIESWYGAVGVNVSVPIFTGFRISSRVKQAELRVEAQKANLNETENVIASQVRQSWLSARSAYEKVSVTTALVGQTTQALDLAQTRYQLGLSSIVELSQAQLQKTQAEISNAQAHYDYRLAQSILRYESGG